MSNILKNTWIASLDIIILLLLTMKRDRISIVNTEINKRELEISPSAWPPGAPTWWKVK
jgi:hypothetical protein